MRPVRDLGEVDRRLPFAAVAAVGAAAFAVLVAGASVAVVREPRTVVQAAPSPTPSPTPSATPSATPSPTPTATKTSKPDDPSDYLLDITTVEDDWVRIPDIVAGVGKLGIEEAAIIEAGGRAPTAKDRKVLRDAGFVRGHARAWRDDTFTLLVFVYEWKDTSGPLTFVRGMKAVTEDTADWQPRTPQSAGVCRRQDGQTFDGALTAVGKHSFLVVTMRGGGCAQHEPTARMTDLFARHAKRLGA